MLWSKAFIPTLREKPQEAESMGHTLLLRAGLARMLAAGIYSYLPLGLKVLNNIGKIIRQEMQASGASELLLAALQPLELWQQTGRDKVIGEVMIRFKDRRGRNICLGPTHEEVITELVKNNVSSYRQLPLVLFQIQAKFRDEIRPRFGLIRSCEFIMKDAYSFDKDEEGLEKNYRIMYEAYTRIFKRLGLAVSIIEADSGVMGGKVSHEFMVAADNGEDVVSICPNCSSSWAAAEGKAMCCPGCQTPCKNVNAIEVGHIFKLGTKYSSALEANFADEAGVSKPILMGCYGIGVSRLISAIIEQNNDANGIIFPKEVSPFQVVILPLDPTQSVLMDTAQRLYKELAAAGVEALMDDRNERAGVKFKDADLIGVPLQIILGSQAMKEGKIEIKRRRDKQVVAVDALDTAKVLEVIAATPSL